MSDEKAVNSREQRRLRRSIRNRRGSTKTWVVESSSGTESIESEAETIVGGSIRGYTESESEVITLGGFSTLTQIKFGAEESEGETSKRMSRKEGSKDSGRGDTPAPGLVELMNLMVQDGKRRDEEMRR